MISKVQKSISEEINFNWKNCDKIVIFENYNDNIDNEF